MEKMTRILKKLHPLRSIMTLATHQTLNLITFRQCFLSIIKSCASQYAID